MTKKESAQKIKIIRLAGFVGMIAALLNVVADIIFQGVASGEYSADMQFMWEVSDIRLRVGAFLGVAVIPFAIIGYWHVYQGIKNAGRFLAVTPVFIASYAAAIGSGVHFAMIHPALVGRFIDKAPENTVPLFKQLHESMVAVNNDLFWVVVGFAIFAIWWMILVFTGKTKYPRWAGVFNPFFIQIAFTVIMPLIPEVGAYLTPASSALSYFVFFGLSIKWLWNCDA